MDIKKYIESGILEQYVLGKVSNKERLEIEAYAQQYPEIKAEIEAIEIALEDFALMHQVTPSPGGLDKIMDQIDTPTAAPTPLPAKRGISWFPIAASLLFIVSAIFAWMQFNQNKDLRKQNVEFDTRLNTLIADRDLCNTQYRQLQTKLNIIRAEGNKPVMMKGQDQLEGAIATVHWNTTSGDSYLDIINLPTPAADKQYQLWAIIDGKPTDMGPLDKSLTTDNFIEIPHFENVQAFAVSEEPLGGSTTPTAVVMIGAI